MTKKRSVAVKEDEEEGGESPVPAKKTRKATPKIKTDVKKEVNDDSSASSETNGIYAFDDATGGFSVADSSTAMAQNDADEA